MNFLTMQQELQDRLGVYNQTVSSDATKLKRWLNMAQQYICSKRLWPFLLSEEIIQTVVDVTGTCATVVGNATVSFTAPVTDSKTNCYIQTGSSNDWYRITSHNVGASSCSIYPSATTTSGSTSFKIRKLLYTTTTPLIQILDMKQLTTPVRIISVSPREADFFLPLYYDAGIPYYYIMSSPDSSGNLQFSFILSPDSVMNINIRGQKMLTDMSSDSDTSLIPNPWQDAIINIASYYGFQTLDDTRAEKELVIGENRIQEMMKNYVLDQGRHRVMQPVDNNSNFGLQWALPSNFGPSVP